VQPKLELKFFLTSITVAWVAVILKMTTKTATTTKKITTTTSVCSKSGWTFCFPERFARSPCTGGSSPRSLCRILRSEAQGKYCRRWASAHYSRKECSCNPPRRMKWQKYFFLEPKKRSRLQVVEVVNKQNNIALWRMSFPVQSNTIIIGTQHNTSYYHSKLSLILYTLN